MQKLSKRFNKVDNALVPQYFEKHIDGDFYIYVAHQPVDIYLNGLTLYDIVYIETSIELGSMFFYKDIRTGNETDPMIEPVAFALVDLIQGIDAGK